MKINEFDKTVDELYQLCRRVQKETGRTVAFHFANYKIGCSLHINISGGVKTARTMSR